MKLDSKKTLLFFANIASLLFLIPIVMSFIGLIGWLIMHDYWGEVFGNRTMLLNLLYLLVTSFIVGGISVYFSKRQKMIIAALMLLIAILYVVEIIDFGFASFIIPHLLIAEGEEIISSYKKMYIFGGVTALITSYLLKTRYSE